MPPEKETGFTEHENELIFSLYQGNWSLLDPNLDFKKSGSRFTGSN
jgi:hypothetical protein